MSWKKQWRELHPGARPATPTADFLDAHHCHVYGKEPDIMLFTTELDGQSYQCFTPGCCSCAGSQGTRWGPYRDLVVEPEQLSLF